MIIRAFEYYFDFKCIAGRCEDTCCAGWEIDIDDKSYESYMQVPGELGERLKKSIKTYDVSDEDGYEEIYEQHGFILDDDLRCPFLDKCGLCELYSALGEGALCEVCTNTPRNFLEYGKTREISISASCPESARLLYASPEKLVICEKTTDEEFPFEEDEEELAFAGYLKEARDAAIDILQSREYDIKNRIEAFLLFAEKVQDRINRMDLDPIVDDDTDRLNELKETAKKGCKDIEPEEDNDIYRNFLMRLSIYSGLASIGDAWKETVEAMYELFADEDGAGPEEQKNAYINADSGVRQVMKSEKREYEYEHLAVYYAFLLLARCVDDRDFLSRAKLVKMSCEFGRDMDALIFAQTGHFSKADREKNARIYAREVEHSEENLYDLHEEILFS